MTLRGHALDNAYARRFFVQYICETILYTMPLRGDRLDNALRCDLLDDIFIENTRMTLLTKIQPVGINQ